MYQGDFPELPEDLRGHFDRLFAQDNLYAYSQQGTYELGKGYPETRYMTVWEAEIENLRAAERLDTPDRNAVKHPWVITGLPQTSGGYAIEETGRQHAERRGTQFLYEDTRQRQMNWVRQTLSQYGRETILDMMYGRKGRTPKQRGVE